MLIELPNGKTTVTEHDEDRIPLRDTDLLDIAAAHPHLEPVLQELQAYRRLIETYNIIQ